ncbi:MAG TPA: hypothetical protein VIH96_25635 [Paraburkholderia sp.]
MNARRAALWCAPQLVALIANPSSAASLAGLEGNATGCAIALFCAPILSHRLGYE